MSECVGRRDEAAFPGYDRKSWPADVRDTGVHSALADLLRDVHAESPADEMALLERFARLAVTHMRGVAYASVMALSGRRRARTSAPAGSVAFLIDMLHHELGEGPGFDCVATRTSVRADNLAAARRWPRFGRTVVVQTPVRSMLCYPLRTPTRAGVLSLHATAPYEFDSSTEKTGWVLATRAALTAQALIHKRAALGGRDIIGRAKGVLMERYGIGSASAFSLLIELAEKSHTSVVVTARKLVTPEPGRRGAGGGSRARKGR